MQFFATATVAFTARRLCRLPAASLFALQANLSLYRVAGALLLMVILTIPLAPLQAANADSTQWGMARNPRYAFGGASEPAAWWIKFSSDFGLGFDTYGSGQAVNLFYQTYFIWKGHLALGLGQGRMPTDEEPEAHFNEVVLRLGFPFIFKWLRFELMSMEWNGPKKEQSHLLTGFSVSF